MALLKSSLTHREFSRFCLNPHSVSAHLDDMEGVNHERVNRLISTSVFVLASNAQIELK